jgi:hypothetical protein
MQFLINKDNLNAESEESVVDAHLKFIEEEIEIKIMSRKNELDEPLENYRDELKNIKKEIFELVYLI